MIIREVMTKNPAFCAPSSSAQTAALIMQQNDTGIVPVTEDAFSRKLVGVVTDRDLCLAVVVRGRDPSHVWIQECMTRDPVTCHLDEDVGVALRRMRENQVRRLPVVDHAGDLKGIVSLSDLVRQFAISPDELLDTLKNICEPVPKTKLEGVTRHAA